MRTSIRQHVTSAASIVAAAGILAGGVALRPAFAVGGAAQFGPFALVHCSNATYCQAYLNGGKGVGIVGSNSNSGTSGLGVFGSSTGGGGGVKGAAHNGIGVSGLSDSNYGVEGQSTTGVGVYGSSVDNAGIMAQASAGSGALSATNTGVGPAIEAHADGSAPAIFATSSSGYGMEVFTGAGGASLGLYIDDSQGPAAQILGTTYGVIAQATAGSGFPLVAEDQFGNNLMYVDGVGNLFIHGTYNTFARTRGGNVAAAFVPSVASPTIEDDGTAHLVNGNAVVRLDPAFARSIDTSRAYHVVLTPDGDTRGLFIASKTPASFIVREVQGGRGTLDFDYHIYARTLGQGQRRMVEMTPAQAQSDGPHTPRFKPVEPPIRSRG
jgi:hypothetical protein